MADDYEFYFPPTPAHLEAIGMLVVESAVLENVLELAIWQINKLVFKEGAFKTIHMGFRMKSACFLKSARSTHKKPEDQVLLRGIAKDLKQAGRERSMVVHGSWAWGIKHDTPLLVKYRVKRNRLIGNLNRTTASDIKKMAANANMACNNVIGFMMSRGYEPPPLRNR